MAYIAGKNGKVTVAGTELSITKWEVEDKTEKVDRTNSQTGGYKKSASSVKSATGTISCHWDGAANPMDSPGIYAGAEVAIKCYLSGTSGPHYDFPTALVESSKMSVEIEGGVDIEFSFDANGTFTRPAGSV